MGRGRMWRARWLSAFAVGACVAPSLVAAQAGPPMELARLTGTVELDGVPDEDAWSAVESLPLTMYFPTFRGTPSQRTVIKVAYDDRYLYAAGWFYDDDPSEIRINSLYRDRWNGDDAFAIYVDAFNDNQNAKWFGVNAAAMRFDLLVSDDGAVLNGSWDTFWDARTTITDEGWFAEVRVPFSSLGFQVDDEGRADMGLTVTRLVSRTGERVTFPAIDPQFLFRQPSVAQDIQLEGVQTQRPAYFTPYLLSGPRLREGARWGACAPRIGPDARLRDATRHGEISPHSPLGDREPGARACDRPRSGRRRVGRARQWRSAPRGARSMGAAGAIARLGLQGLGRPRVCRVAAEIAMDIVILRSVHQSVRTPVCKRTASLGSRSIHVHYSGHRRGRIRRHPGHQVGAGHRSDAWRIGRYRRERVGA